MWWGEYYWLCVMCNIPTFIHWWKSINVSIVPDWFDVWLWPQVHCYHHPDVEWMNMNEFCIWNVVGWLHLLSEFDELKLLFLFFFFFQIIVVFVNFSVWVWWWECKKFNTFFFCAHLYYLFVWLIKYQMAPHQSVLWVAARICRLMTLII